uniref:protein disulfide-isomerase n=1 Tax=Astyanax mexicanus TaxID=7994 RepID=A0A8B9HKK3_ASTMX
FEVGAELKNSGSPVRVGKMDATAYSGMSVLCLLKGELAYNYKGPRTKDDIIEFANRVAGPAVRSLPSKQMFEHVLKRHDVLFVYVGGESPLKEKYIDVASELIVYTYFFSASEDVLPESVTFPELPSVVVFKDGSYFTYDEYEDGSLSSWVNRERFQSYLQIDGFTLYELGETEFMDWIRTNPEHFSNLVSIHQKCAEKEESVNWQKGHGHLRLSDVINGGSTSQLTGFLKHLGYSPVLGCFLFGLPLGVISLMCYGICTAESDDGAEDMELMKREGLTDEEDEEDEEEERRRQAGKLEGPAEEDEGEEEVEEKIVWCVHALHHVNKWPNLTLSGVQD